MATTAKKKKAPQKKKETFQSRLPKIGRDGALFFGGMAGVFHEVVISKVERPVVLGLLAAMMGLPAFLRADEKNKDEEEE